MNTEPVKPILAPGIIDFSIPSMARNPETAVLAKPNINMVLDVSEGSGFFRGSCNPHVPVLAAFEATPLHVCALQEGSWDIARAAAENSERLVRSFYSLPSDGVPEDWDDLTFQFGPRAFLYADGGCVVGFAASHIEAERLVKQFDETYAKAIEAPQPSGGDFHMIKTGSHKIECVTVSLPADTILGQEAFPLHYGSRAMEWHESFVEKLRTKRHGLSILEGSPGTGKTSYLRHLIGTLKESHRFYFIPTSSMGILSSPNFIEFWADEREDHSERQFAVILEDSDAALMTRGSDNREQVSAILNLSDGMLADFLRLQIICTINCAAADIDQALLRPGRLLSHRVFDRLDYRQAARLAERLGKDLPVVRDYSLAEIFAETDLAESKPPRIGFAA